MSRLVLSAALAIALLVAPWLAANDFYINLGTQILIYAVFALSLNLLVGFGGLTSLGHAAYLGGAAYSCAWLIGHTGLGHASAAVVALAFTAVMAGLFGLLSLRATGLGFLMITLALGQIMWGMAYRWVNLTGGDNGLRLSTRPSPFGLDLSAPIPFYYFTAIVFGVALFCLWRLARSPFGAALRGTRDQPRRMRMLGHNVWLTQWLAFVMAGFWAGVAGLLYVYYNKFISPNALSLQQSAEVLLMTILGGASTLSGPIVGAIVITLVKNLISSYVERWNTLLGAIFVIAVIFMPDGLVPGFGRLWRRLRGGAVPKPQPQPQASSPAKTP